MMSWDNINIQESESPITEQLSIFHDNSMLILLMIMTLISYFMIMLISNKISSRFTIESQVVETLWTILPAVTLIFIALPSLHLLYLIDEISKPLMTIKSMGHQWYWSYEYSDFPNLEFDSFINFNSPIPRLMDTDNHLIIPTMTFNRMIISASDVIHSWSLPSLGIKIDGTPGRLNQTNLFSKQPLISYGQCSEICGINHSFMPILMESVPTNEFMTWIKKN